MGNMTTDTLAEDPRFDLVMSHESPDGGLNYWLTLYGKPVSFLKVYLNKYTDGNELELCDIETRSGYEHRGYATKLLKVAAEKHGVDQVVHRGSYTPDGFNFIASKVKREGARATGPSYNPMTFVHDWDDFAPAFR